MSVVAILYLVLTSLKSCIEFFPTFESDIEFAAVQYVQLYLFYLIYSTKLGMDMRCRYLFDRCWPVVVFAGFDKFLYFVWFTFGIQMNHEGLGNLTPLISAW